MNEVLQKYQNDLCKQFSENVQIERPEKEVLEAWLDERLRLQEETFKQLHELDFNIVYGKFDESTYEYEVEIRPCQYTYEPRIHIYEGIDKLAEILGKEIYESETNNVRYPYRYHFTYKGHEVFQLGKEGYKK